MMLASTAALPASIPSVSGATPTIHPPPTAAIMAASVAEAANHNQKDTTYTKIFVGGLPYHTTDKSLREHFEVYGEIDEAVVITDRQTGKSRGYGFVTMTDRSGAERAIKDPNPVIDGRKANVNLAYLGAKPRGNQSASYASMAPAAMRLYSHLSGAGSHYSIQPPANYVYHLPYASAAGHLPFISAQTAHLNPAAATLGYTPTDYQTNAAGYTTAAYPATPTALEQPYGIAFSPAAAGLQSYNYAALTHAAAASAASNFSLGPAAAYHSPVAAAAAAAAQPPQATLQEARMQ